MRVRARWCSSLLYVGLTSAVLGGYAPDLARAEGSPINDEPRVWLTLCARIKSANQEVPEEKAVL